VTLQCVWPSGSEANALRCSLFTMLVASSRLAARVASELNSQHGGGIVWRSILTCFATQSSTSGDVRCLIALGASLRSHAAVMDGSETRSLRSETAAATPAGGTVIADVAYSPVSTSSSTSLPRLSKQAPASVALMDVRYPTKWVPLALTSILLSHGK